MDAGLQRKARKQVSETKPAEDLQRKAGTVADLKLIADSPR